MINCKQDYEMEIAKTRPARMAWWKEARYGMFIHFGLYSQLGRNEWAMALENYSVKEYEKLADNFIVNEGVCEKWAKLAKASGMKYMVLTTRHHEGFSLWDSKVNPYNSVNYGSKRDIVKEFVEACRKYDLKIGFYSSLMDWHHEDGYACAYDQDARRRFNDYIYALNEELMTNYGKIDVLWYDVPRPMEHHEGWNSLALNQMVRKHQPDIIINNRSLLDEDFQTPEEKINEMTTQWEACMTFNQISWGYIDSDQANNYSYNAYQIVKMLSKVTSGSGNLLLNIGPMPDGEIPKEVIKPLETVGKWLEGVKEAVYGVKEKTPARNVNGICSTSFDGKNLYVWNYIWPKEEELVIGGVLCDVKEVINLHSGEKLSFRKEKQRIVIENIGKKPFDDVLSISVFKLVLANEAKFVRCSMYPQLNGGKQY